MASNNGVSLISYIENMQWHEWRGGCGENWRNINGVSVMHRKLQQSIMAAA